MTPDALSGWTTPPRAARLIGDEAYRAFDTLEDAIAFLRRATSDAQRQARCRRRRREGLVVFKIEVPEADTIAGLIKAGRLSEEEALDMRLVRQAFEDVAADWAEDWKRKSHGVTY